jgi:proteasome accessory factor B
MAARRTERLLNLVICLLATRRFVPREQIRKIVPGYADSESDEAFERMFERDKDDLRDMGIPLETGSNSAWFEDEIGYRIDRDRYALPAVSFEPEELAVLGLAARVWQSASFAHAASQAILKLEASGADIDADALALVEPRVAAAEASFGGLYEAVRDGRPVTFGYRAPGAQQPTQRSLEPWGIVSWHGHWYVVGHDLDREATRVFRLSRVEGTPRFTGPPGTVTVPPDVSVRDQVQMLTPRPADQTATLRAREGAAVPLRRRATATSAGESGWDVLHVGYADEESLAEEIVGFGADVVAVAPEELRESVVRRLTAVLAAASGGAA